jgi:hypothetical protein
MEAAHDRFPGITPGAGQVIGFEDEVPGAPRRAEKSNSWVLQDFEVTQGGEATGSTVLELMAEMGGEVWMVLGETLRCHERLQKNLMADVQGLAQIKKNPWF